MKKQNGITMISLIITIIVMLILAAVAVSMVVGDDAVIEQAKGATASQNQANAESEIQRAWAAAELDYWTDHSDVSKAEFFAAHLGDYVSSGSVTAVDYVEDGISKITYTDVTGASYTVEVATAKAGGTSSLPSPVAPEDETTGSTSGLESPVAPEEEEETTTNTTTSGSTSGVESPVAKETYTVSAKSATGGTATYTTSEESDGTHATITAHEKSGYTFSRWTVSGSYELVDGTLTDEEFTILLKSDVTVTPSFVKASSSSSYASPVEETIPDSSYAESPV